MPDACIGGAEHPRGPSAAEDRAQKARLTRDWEHFARNYGQDSPQACSAAAALASFEEAARQRARASKPVAQLLCTAAQEMQAARRRHQVRLDAVRAAQEGLTAA